MHNEGLIMSDNWIRKALVFVIIGLFIGAGVVPSISSNVSSLSADNTLYVDDGNTYLKTNNQDVINLGSEGTEYWALLVAVGVYADSPGNDRPLMLEEVDDLYDLLLQSEWWSEDHIKVIKGEDATISNIIQGLRWLDKMEDSDDISMVFITTHGFPLDVDIPPLDEDDGVDEGLVSYWGFAYLNLFLWDDELNFLLNRLESQGVCLIVDSCFAGGFNDPPDWNITGINKYSNTQDDYQESSVKWIDGFGEDVQGQGRVVLMASREDEVSYSGGFSPYLIDGLRGFADTNLDDVITAEEAFYYAEPRASWQHPTMYDGYDGELPLFQLGSTVQADETSKNQIRSEIKTTEKQTNAEYAEENSVVCGYIEDSGTSDPIENAYVSVRGYDNQWDVYENETTTGEFGYYSMDIPSGRFRVSAYADGYLSARSSPFEIDEYETIWINLSLGPHPDQNAAICGYITDEKTGDPIEGTTVDLFWGNQNQFYINDTLSDPSGFYLINVAAGHIDLDVEASGYFLEYSEGIIIDEYETAWLNVSLYPRPQKNAIFCGYITDDKTGDPLSNARVSVEQIDIAQGFEYGNETYTDSLGFFSINIAAGEVYHDIRKGGYDYYNPYRLDIVDYGTLWMNVSLSEKLIEVEIAKPLNAFYIDNERVTPFPEARIIGEIEIEAYIPGSWNEPGDADKVEFYIDDILKATVTSKPFNWTWDEITIGKHTIKVIAYDDEGNSTSDEITVWKFF